MLGSSSTFVGSSLWLEFVSNGQSLCVAILGLMCFANLMHYGWMLLLLTIDEPLVNYVDGAI